MLKYREIVLALRRLEIEGKSPVIAHASLSAFGNIDGGAATLLAALMQQFKTILMPTFTYKTMLMPAAGPENNACNYGSLSDVNKTTLSFHPEMPADKLMGILPEMLRKQRGAIRSLHPILSFSGINAQEILETQTLKKPLAPIAKSAELDAWVLLLGVGHKANTSIHLGERLAGRKTFLRWALMPNMVLESPGFPSCSDGFDAISISIESDVRRTFVGNAEIQAIPLKKLLESTQELINKDSLSLLCNNFYCQRCRAVRDDVENKWQSPAITRG